METEISYKRQIEKIEVNGNFQEVWGIKSCKSFRAYIQSKINHYIKHENKEMEMMLRTILGIYDKFHPELKATVEIEGWRGKSGIQVIKYPEYFEVIEHRKTDKDSEVKEIKHKVYKNGFNSHLKALQSIILDKVYKTSEFAEIWARTNHIWENADGNKIIDVNGFNFANVSGCRATYFEFYYPLKVLEWLEVIKYEKSGKITKIKENFDIQSEFC